MRALFGLLLLTATPALAFETVPRKPGGLGLGLGGGTRTSGISAKYTMDSAFSLQGVVGTDFGRYRDRGGTLALSVDAMFEMPPLHTDKNVEIAWGVGVGPYMAVGDNFWLGASGVLGIQLHIQPVPLEFTLEWRPSFELVGPHPDGRTHGFYPLGIGGHIRWWFTP